MHTLRRRWRSIDHTLPLLASSLVLLTVVVLGWTAYVFLERELVDARGRRLLTSARLVAEVIQRPSTRLDSTGRAAALALRGFIAGTTSHEDALASLARPITPGDTTKVYAALLDPAGKPLLTYHHRIVTAPEFVLRAVAAGEIRGDTVSIGPIENLAGVPSLSIVHPLRDSSIARAPLVGYVVETRAIVGRRVAFFRGLVGDSVTMLVGQPGMGAWTDVERVAADPPVLPRSDSIQLFAGGVGAAASVPGTNWVVWLSQSRQMALAPARSLLLTMAPIGIIIALVGAALMWRMARRITSPIAQLTAAAESVAADSTRSSDEIAVPLPAHANEVTRLRVAFERMANRLAEREALEAQLRHAQKMEAIGHLAGGVAHDFNNLLTAIRAYADLMLDDMPAWDTKRGDVLEIRKAADRAAALTAQLLAFSRKQMLQPRVLDTRLVVDEVQSMLRRLLAEDIELTVDAPADVWPVKADRGQLEQVLVNLAVNARDAMPHGGALRIRASNKTVAVALPAHNGTVQPGDYVALSVTDTGLGMEGSVRSRVFEPFFTTKTVGRGTGLGLATVEGIVAQSGGHVTVDSAPAEGTTFTVYLPRVHEAPAAKRVSSPNVARGSSETILLVEDEPAVRALARRVLVRAGFRVLEAKTPSDALRLALDNASVIKLILTDVVMPEMSGPTLVSKIMEFCPTPRVLYTSGYTDDEVIGRGLANPQMQLLQKPFSAQQLVERVREALDEPHKIVQA